MLSSAVMIFGSLYRIRSGSKTAHSQAGYESLYVRGETGKSEKSVIENELFYQEKSIRNSNDLEIFKWNLERNQSSLLIRIQNCF